MKKILSFVLALVMVLSMASVALGATDYSITITNDPEKTNISIDGQEFRAYRIFDMTHEAVEGDFTTDTAVAYTINSDWEDLSYTYENVTYTGQELVDFVAQNGKNEVTMTAFTEYVWTQIYGKGANSVVITWGKKLDNGTEVVTFNTLDPGYYLVYCMTGNNADIVTACIVTTTDPKPEIELKGSAPDIDKVIVDSDDNVEKNGAAYDIGDTVDFKIKSTAPNTKGYTKYTYILHDTLSKGLTLDPNSVKVTVNGFTETLNVDYTFTPDPNDSQKFSIALLNCTDYTPGWDIEISYSAVLNSNALIGDVEKNTANIEYSNDPYDETKTTKTPDDEVYVYDFEIDIDKYASDNVNEKLTGAKFVLKNSDGKYYKIDSSTPVGNIEWVDDIDNATVVETSVNGEGTFNGLDDGTYYLKEIEAPDGYNLLEDEKEVVIAPTYAENGTLDLPADTNISQKDNLQYYVEVDVPNNAGTLLPSTGGMGTVIFYVIGGMLVLGSVVLLVTKKRMNATK